MKISNDVFFIEREPIFQEQLCYNQGGEGVSLWYKKKRPRDWRGLQI